jgi:hypothetical protein
MEVEFKNLIPKDVWRSNELHVQLYPLRGKEGIVVDDMELDEVDLYVTDIPDSFFD